MQTPRPLVDFKAVEDLRRLYLLRKRDMAFLFDVSRITYYAWINGKYSPNYVQTVKIKRILKAMLSIPWDSKYTREDRLLLILELLKD
jgi:DNA-binding XRE family transcriptional regulator